MKRMCRVWVAGLAAAAVLSIGGCGLLDGDGDTEAKPDPALRTASTKVKEAKTLRASLSIKHTGGTLTGEADIAAGEGVSVAYTYKTSSTVNSVQVDGNLLAVDDKVFLRSSNWKPPAGKKWNSVNPGTPAKVDQPFPPEWFALVTSRLLDPLFLLDQGLADIEGVTATPDTVDGTAATKYTMSWYLESDKPGPELTAWAAQIGDAAVLDISLWVDGDGRPAKLKLDTSTGVMQFWANVAFHDYGANLTVAAPPAEEVAPR